MAKKTISMPPELYAAACRRADAEHRTLSNYISQLIRRDVMGAESGVSA